MRPSDARIDDLQDAYVDQSDVKKVYTSADPQLKAMELQFDTRGKAEKEFGESYFGHETYNTIQYNNQFYFPLCSNCRHVGAVGVQQTL